MDYCHCAYIPDAVCRPQSLCSKQIDVSGERQTTCQGCVYIVLACQAYLFTFLPEQSILFGFVSSQTKQRCEPPTAWFVSSVLRPKRSWIQLLKGPTRAICVKVSTRFMGKKSQPELTNILDKTLLGFQLIFFPCLVWSYYYIIILDSQLLLPRGSEFQLLQT